MNPKKKKKTSVKINPLKGRFFDIKPPKEGTRPPKSNTRKGFWRFFWMAFIIFIALNIANIYMRGKELAEEGQKYALTGYEYLNNGIQSLKKKDLNNADDWFKKAEISFMQLKENTGHIIYQTNDLVNKSLYLDVAKKLVDSAISVSQMGQKAIDIIRSASKIPKMFIRGDLEDGKKVTDIVKEQKVEFGELYDDALTLQQNLTTLNSSILSDDMREKIKEGQELIGNLFVPLAEFNSSFDTALIMLGDKVPHTYLVLFQNNHELRATGGFIGSYIIIDMNDGALTKMEAKDVYESDGQLTAVVESPLGIDQVSDRWFMRDANYSPDFPTSAEQIMWFLEHSQGPSADTVIAIDQTVIERLLELTGEIRLENFPFQIRSSNFNQIISYYIEAKLSETTTPKQLLFDFIPVFKEKFFNVERFEELIAVLGEMVDSGHIQVYSKDAEIQKLAERLKIDGRMTVPAEKTDFLAPVTTNIGGNKSDQYIHTDIEHKSEISQTGLIMDYLTITKNHTWEKDDFAGWQKLIDRYGTGETGVETLRFIQGEGRNLDYMRVYVPKGSKLLKSEGVNKNDIDITDDLGYTVFGFTFGPTKSGESSTIQLQYQLPFSLSFYPSDNYRFIAQKQAGAENITLTKSLITAENLTVTENYPASQKIFSLMPEVEMDFDKNQIFLSAISSNL